MEKKDIDFLFEVFKRSYLRDPFNCPPPFGMWGGQLERSTHDLTTMKNSLSSIYLMVIIEMAIKKIDF